MVRARCGYCGRFNSYSNLEQKYLICIHCGALYKTWWNKRKEKREAKNERLS